MANPPNPHHWQRYRARIDAVISYIHANPDGNLSSDALAEVAHLSPYHWHRIYRAITGESVVATVKRTRMHLAATLLLRDASPIADICKQVGYPEVHSFNRTFKAFYGVSPGQFRQCIQTPDIPESDPASVNTASLAVTVGQYNEWLLIGRDHPGDYMLIGETFTPVMAQCATLGLLEEQTETAGVYFCDPDVVEDRKLRSFAGVRVADNTATPDGLTRYVCAGGRYAVLEHIGPYALLHQSYRWLYEHWLPESGEAVRDLPCIEKYLNNPINTDPADLRTAICLPIE